MGTCITIPVASQMICHTPSPHLHPQQQQQWQQPTTPSRSDPDQAKANGMKTLFSRSLTKTWVSLLARGTNYAVVPSYSPEGEYITAVEKPVSKFPPQWQRSSNMCSTPILISLRKIPRPYRIQTGQGQSYTHSGQWGGMVVLNRQDYISKAKDLLVQKDTYRPLTADPTNKHKTN